MAQKKKKINAAGSSKCWSESEQWIFGLSSNGASNIFNFYDVNIYLISSVFSDGLSAKKKKKKNNFHRNL